MTAYERRVVHVALRDDRRVATASEGEDPFRMVVVSPEVDLTPYLGLTTLRRSWLLVARER